VGRFQLMGFSRYAAGGGVIQQPAGGVVHERTSAMAPAACTDSRACCSLAAAFSPAVQDSTWRPKCGSSHT
jgi:hypothetical protein